MPLSTGRLKRAVHTAPNTQSINNVRQQRSQLRPVNRLGVNLTVAQYEEEAAAIARLLGDDRQRTVGWVYLWNTSALSVLWIDRPCTARSIAPSLPPEVLAKAKPMTPVAVTDFLEGLPTEVDEGPE